MNYENNINGIFVKEIMNYDNNEVIPVDWTMSSREAYEQLGEYTEYSLEEGVEVIIDEFDDYEVLGVFRTAKEFYNAVMVYCIDEEYTLEECYDIIDNNNCFVDDGEPHAYIIQNFPDEVSIHEFGEFNSLLGHNNTLYLKKIINDNHFEKEWKKMVWLLNIKDDDEIMYILDLEHRGFESADLIYMGKFCCRY